MTPEEKLLALIQQDKRQAASPAAVPVAVSQNPESRLQNPEPVSVMKNSTTGITTVGETPAPPETPQPLKKLKLAEVAEKPEVSIQNPESRIQNPEVRSQKAEAPSVPEIDTEVYGLKSKVSFFSAPLSSLTILNRVMTVLVVGLIAVVFYGIMSIRPGIAQELNRQIEGAGSLAVMPQAIVEEGVPALEAYLEKVGSRNLFIAKVISPNGDPVVVEKAGAPKDLSLVAVSMDTSSPADSMAIIKNKTDSKTYFVKLGQTVGSTDYVLDRVLADRIVLKQKKMEFELK
jgi:hypothetical protein